MIPRWFISMVLAWLEFDLKIARSTGRNPTNIAAISGAINEWDLILLRKDTPLLPPA